MSSISKSLAAVWLSFVTAVPATAADAKPGICAPPVWPTEAVRYELEGTTTLNFRLDEEGRVTETAVVQSSRWDLLDQAAIQSLSACKFRPELGKQARGRKIPVQYVWTLEGGERSHPVLVEGSCPPSERFSRFAPLDKGLTGPDGILVRLLIVQEGTPFRAKAEARDADPGLVQAALEYVQACRFAPEANARFQRTDTLTGRVLLK